MIMPFANPRFPHKRCVYFLQSGDAIKVGCTDRLGVRMPAIEAQLGNQVECIGWVFGSFGTENLIHKRLDQYRVKGEWFYDCPQVRELIQFITERGPFFYGLPPIEVQRKR